MSLRLNLTAIAAVLALAACDAGGPAADAQQPVLDASGPGDEVVQVPEEDAAMNAAIAEARQTLPVYLARLDAGRLSSDDSLKVGLPVPGGGVEHIWVDHVARDGDRLTGLLANQPNMLPDLSQGSSVTFTPDMVSDWSYISDDKMWGNYTTRVMLPYLGEEDAARLRRDLSATPVEPSAR